MIGDDIKIKGHWRWTTEDLETGEKTIIEEDNYLPDGGLGILAALICGELTNTSSWHIAWGTDQTASVAGTVKLVAEAGRKEKALLWREAGVVKIRIYLITSEGNGTNYEWGIFVAGTDSADSGYLVNRVLPVGGIPKTSSQVLTVEIDLTLARG